MLEKVVFDFKNGFECLENIEIVKKIEENGKLIQKINFSENIYETSFLKNSRFFKRINTLYHTESLGTDLIACIVEKSTLKSDITNDLSEDKSVMFKDDCEDKKEDIDDIWLEDDILYYPKQITWDVFKNPLSTPYINPFITEKSMQIFDYLLVRKLNHIYSPQEAGILVDSTLLYKSLLLLSLGESSPLFSWDKKYLKFFLLVENLKVTGCTKESTRSVINFFMSIGTHTSRLGLFVDSVKENALSHDPCVLAFISCITEILKNYRNILVSDLDDIKRPLFLLNYVEKYSHIEESLKNLASLCFRDLETFSEPPFPEIKKGIHLLNMLYTFACENFYRNKKNILPISKFLLKYSSYPWLKMLEQWIGFQKMALNKTTLWKGDKDSWFFIHEKNNCYFENNMNLDEYLKIDNVNCLYLPKLFFQNVYDIGKSIKLLYKLQPNHPLCRILNKEIDSLEVNIQLEWRFHWESINNLIKQVKIYKEIMEIEIEKFENFNKCNKVKKIEKTSTEKSEFNIFEHSKQKIVDSINESISFFENEIKDTSPFNKDLDMIYSEENVVPIDTIPMYCFMIPLIVQSDLVNKAVMKLFFKDVELKRHLSLLWKVKLFDDGLFILNLSYALFGYSFEHNKYSLELNCGSGLKKKWPPKSIELVIALRNVLVDTFGSEFLLSKKGFGTESSLLGGLSFSVKEINESEFKLIKDPYNIEALDFLKIVYTPSFPLNEIITNSCLIKYDQLTNFLLRLIRMNDIVTKLFDVKTNDKILNNFKMTLKFRFYSRYFIYILSCYVFNIILPLNHDKLNKYLTNIEYNLSQSTFTSLTRFHMEILDHILFSCFLTSSQEVLIHIVTDIFSVILKFSKVFFQYQSQTDILSTNSLIYATNTLYPLLVEHVTKFVQMIHHLAVDKDIYTELDSLLDTKYFKI
ncbi:hypothetical protein PORY_000926 [Pneumocystis oryctolagi]|uniref:Uncharacterized protein n=1 Tax=Pneumocystis oryctolagi TaxID=42067 RepID=A0ACB7CDA1_9ASCO|nr:hypothetical protein PORY_000926 [Pneumocystis oryctolagi]